jgi:Retron-type reverse transcriptase
MNNKLCAPPDGSTQWTSIDWKQAKIYVRKLQMRIVKAHQQGRYGKVQALQRLLVTSFYAKALAVKRVTENKGKRTAGVDKEIWHTPKAKWEAIFKLKRHGYHPKPLKRIYILKKNGKMRPLSIPTMTDRALQTLYKFALEPIAEATADPNSYGFRPKRCPQDAIEQCFCALAKSASPKWVLEGDIRGCFDHISHDWILEHIPMDKAILKKWLKCGFIEKRELFPTEEGAPQGSPISPTISNMVLDGLQQELRQRFHQVRRNGGMYSPMVNLVRFADDFIITGDSRELLEEQVYPTIRNFLATRGLELSEEKTLITHIDNGFDFLGCNIRKYNGKLLIKPSKKNMKSVLDKIRALIKRNRTVKQELLIRKLNPIIQGWVNYQRYNVSGAAFSYLDYQIFKCLWDWCKRRHPKKGKRWIVNKYFRRINNRSWTFSVPTHKKMDSGKPLLLKLVYATDTKITRFIKIRAKSNPFDEQDAQYFMERASAKMRNSLKGKKGLTSIFRRQGGLCPVCNQQITIETDFIYMESVQTGKTLKSMLHPDCYRTVHTKPFQNEPALQRGL